MIQQKPSEQKPLVVQRQAAPAAAPVHTSPDNLLSSLRIRYDGSASSLQGTPAEIVTNLKRLRAAQLTPVHMTPFKAVPLNPNTFSEVMKTRERLAIEAYWQALHIGNIEATYGTSDAINAIREVTSGSYHECASDFEIFLHQRSPTGEAARWLVNDQLAAAEAEAANEAYVLCAFWTPAGQAAIDAYEL